MPAIVKNNAVATLVSPISAGAVTFSVPSGLGARFPNPTGAEYFYVRLGDDSLNEVVKCTARTGDTVTCVATTSAWSSATPVILTFSKEAYDEIPKMISSNTTYTVRSSGGNFTALADAITALKDVVISDSAIVTIEVDDGEWTQSSTITDAMVGSNRVRILGRNMYTVSMTSVQSSSGSAGNWSVIINVSSVANIAVNDYCQICSASGGTYPELLVGMHEVTNVDIPNTRITINVKHTASTISSGAVSATCYILKTRLKFNASLHGFTINGKGFYDLKQLAIIGAGTAGYKALSINPAAHNQKLLNTGISAFDGYVYAPSDTFTAADHIVQGLPVFPVSSQQIAATTSEIQPALDRAAALGGGTVYIPAGTYKITKPLLIGSNTRLSLDSGAVMIRSANINNMLINDSDGVAGAYEANSNIIVEGGIWDGNGSVITTDTTLIAFGHAEDVTVRSTTIRNLPGDWHAIEFNAVKNGRIINCNFYDCGAATTGTEAIQLDLMKGSAQFPWFGPYDDTTCTDITIEGCKFKGGQRGIGSHSSKAAKRHLRILVNKCIFEDMDQECIYALNYQDFTVTNCIFNDAAKGIYLFTGDSVNSRGFVFSENAFYNISKGADARGIQVLGVSGGASLTEGVISNNVFDTIGTHCIGVDHSSYWVISNNKGRAVERVGVWIFESSYCQVVNNTFKEQGTYYSPLRSIYIGNSSGTASLTSYCIVTGNICEGLYFDYTTNSIGTQNVASAHFTVTGNAVTCQKYSNMVAGSWVA